MGSVVLALTQGLQTWLCAAMYEVTFFSAARGHDWLAHFYKCVSWDFRLIISHSPMLLNKPFIRTFRLFIILIQIKFQGVEILQGTYIFFRINVSTNWMNFPWNLRDIHVHLRENFNNFGEPLTYHVPNFLLFALFFDLISNNYITNDIPFSSSWLMLSAN